jgi:hypothetical protein
MLVMMRTLCCRVQSRRPSRKEVVAPQSLWLKFVWLELHLLRRRHKGAVEIGTMKKHNSEEGDVSEYLPSGVWNSGVQVGNLLLGKNKRRQKQRSRCCKPPLILQLQKGSTWRQLGRPI